MFQTILALSFLSSVATAACPDLTGYYTRTTDNGKTVFMKVQTKIENGATVYEFETGVTTTTWRWKSVADGKSHPKEIKNHENVTEVAFCKDSVLRRKLEGDFPNGGDMHPFVLKADLYNPTPDSLHLHGEFKGYGTEDVYDHRYQRKN